MRTLGLLLLLASCGKDEVNMPGDGNQVTREPQNHIREFCYEGVAYIETNYGLSVKYRPGSNVPQWCHP